MPSNRYGEWKTTSTGTNSQGNKWDKRDYGYGDNTYHYSNKDGSYHYKNPDNSTYTNNGQGSSTYTAPNGNIRVFGDSA
ncbi:hypothetical protein EV714DRAFT_266148 [Schizophyllum commune]